MFTSPRLLHNRITCQTTPYQYILPVPSELQNPHATGLQVTIHPPPSPQLVLAVQWADCTPTAILVQSDQRLPLPLIDGTTQLPAPNTWLYSLTQHLLARQGELQQIAPNHLL